VFWGGIVEDDAVIDAHSEAELRRFFRVIAERFEALNVVVHVRGRLEGEEGIEGSFVPRSNPRSWIGDVTVYRAHEQVPGDALAELMTLVHECGHARSHLAGFASAEYRQVSDRVEDDGASLAPHAKTLVLQEEARAWIFGRKELDLVGFRDWNAYKKRIETDLGIYGTKLKVSVDVDALLAGQEAACLSSG
jgi:hypothetical protein